MSPDVGARDLNGGHFSGRLDTPALPLRADGEVVQSGRRETSGPADGGRWLVPTTNFIVNQSACHSLTVYFGLAGCRIRKSRDPAGWLSPYSGRARENGTKQTAAAGPINQKRIGAHPASVLFQRVKQTKCNDSGHGQIRKLQQVKRCVDISSVSMPNRSPDDSAVPSALISRLLGRLSTHRVRT